MPCKTHQRREKHCHRFFSFSFFFARRAKLRPVVAPAHHADDDGGGDDLLARPAGAVSDGGPLPGGHVFWGQVPPSTGLPRASAG